MNYSYHSRFINMGSMTEIHQPASFRPDALTALAYGVVIWLAATAALTSLGPIVLPAAGTRAASITIPAFSALALLIGIAAFSVFRRSRSDGPALRLLFGSSITSAGLLLDAALYLVAGGQYPFIGAEQQGPLAFFLVFAYGALLVAPHALPARHAKGQRNGAAAV